MSKKCFVLIAYLCVGITIINSDTVDIRVTEEDCTTPDGSKGKCKLLEECPQALNLFANPPKSIQKHLETHLCKSYSPYTVTVCCIAPLIKGTHLPSQQYCGYQHFDDLMLDLRRTSIIEFPWVVAIMKKGKSGEDEIACLGTLITSRYVITSGFCANYEELHNAKIWVRLGEFYGKNNTDCETWERGNLEECSQHEDFNIEETILHPFSSNALLSINYIGLLRLNKSVSYSDYIRPICLQTHETLPVKVGDELLSSGWDDDQIKIKIPSTMISAKQCTGQDSNVHKFLKCVKYKNIKGPSQNCHVVRNGAPILVSIKHQWYLEGVSHLFYHSNGSCFARYTPILTYMDWILENLKP